MKSCRMNPSAIVLALAAFCFAGSASAIPLLCENASAKDAYLDNIHLPSCPDAGVLVDTSMWETQNEIILTLTPASDEKLDAWLVSYLNPLLFSGNWQYTKVRDREGHLTHIKLHGSTPPKNVPEPGTLALLGIGLLCAGIARRRHR